MYTFFFTIYILLNMIFFLLYYNKIHKQKFGALDIVESQSKEIWSVSYVTCVNIVAQVFLT